MYRAYAREAPVPQPLAFSHRTHSGENAIPCLYCHAYARLGPAAGVPSVERCVGCHITAAKDHVDVVKLMEHWEKKEPIRWVRVHHLPEYVRFNHKRHVVAGVQCQVCHGEVQRMDAAVQVSDMTMGWCLSCHEERGASIDCLTCHY
ncbi:MAG: cytochrome c3 family protein [Planctomycetes bacterium]|nr:cytochrome c3 family protein [Planctomycetota bacterium]